MGEQIALLSYFPSPAAIIGLIKSAAFVVLAYHWSLKRRATLRGVAAFVLFMIGLLGLYEGFMLAGERGRNRAAGLAAGRRVRGRL